MNINTIGNMTRRPPDQMTLLQAALSEACNQLNGIVSDLHFLAHEAKPEESEEGVHQWSEDWEHRMAQARTKIASATAEAALRVKPKSE